MITTYQMKASELDKSFIQSVKAQFHDKEITIIISESDETDYLLKSKANRDILYQSLHDAKARKGLHTIDLKDLK